MGKNKFKKYACIPRRGTFCLFCVQKITFLMRQFLFFSEHHHRKVASFCTVSTRAIQNASFSLSRNILFFRGFNKDSRTLTMDFLLAKRDHYSAQTGQWPLLLPSPPPSVLGYVHVIDTTNYMSVYIIQIKKHRITDDIGQKVAKNVRMEWLAGIRVTIISV